MMKTSILQCGVDVIDHLVTGLPSSQAHDPQLSTAIFEKFSGTLQLTPNVEVTVKKVTCLPQPAGTVGNIEAVGADELYELMEEGKTIVVDPGFFSVDWIMMVSGEYQKSTTDSSLQAVSRVLELAGELISKAHGTNPGVAALESAIREGKQYVLVYGRKVEWS